MVRVFGVLLACAFLNVVPARAADVVIGLPAWPSAQVTAHIIADTLSERYGLETELQESGTMTILSKVGKGEFQVHPEVWLPNLSRQVDKLSNQDKVVELSANGVAATQNICATRQTLELTGVKAVADLAKPEYAVKFDTDGDGKGEIWIGAPTWSSTEIEKIRAHSYGYDQTMSLLEMPEDVAMAAVDAAASLGRPIVFYCYGPHHVFQLHDIVVLEEPEYDPARWTIVNRADSNDWLEQSNADTAWDASSFHVAYQASLNESRPEVAAFLAAISLSAEDVTAMSYAVEVEDKPVEEVASEWIASNKDRIGEWTK
ncbi:ABC transporter substrate-binding protein [Roseibium sp. Sym1]|uniref:ABC transporter substrate-binding protein n=1 Tax=Roseibium sp. Sym1 TaxID=3016006 RepID=UPI0022B2AFE6|nr:glycine betaine ABC transporter substrate-binding protein [Roseibium sp. Sym1]